MTHRRVAVSANVYEAALVFRRRSEKRSSLSSEILSTCNSHSVETLVEPNSNTLRRYRLGPTMHVSDRNKNRNELCWI